MEASLRSPFIRGVPGSGGLGEISTGHSLLSAIVLARDQGTDGYSSGSRLSRDESTEPYSLVAGIPANAISSRLAKYLYHEIH